MAQANRVSIKIASEDLQKVLDAIKMANDILKPYLTMLSQEERKVIPRMNDEAFPFVQKTLELARTETAFVPKGLDVDELQIDLDAVKDLLKALRPIEELYNKVNDTVVLCSSEAYMAALAFYNNVKQEAKSKKPRALETGKELKHLFERIPGNVEPVVMTKKKLEKFTWNYLIASGRLSSVL
ncbi:MAG: hypothetical protein ACOYXT_03745 [Bacteroidota bacterium]